MPKHFKKEVGENKKKSFGLYQFMDSKLDVSTENLKVIAYFIINTMI